MKPSVSKIGSAIQRSLSADGYLDDYDSGRKRTRRLSGSRQFRSAPIGLRSTTSSHKALPLFSRKVSQLSASRRVEDCDKLSICDRCLRLVMSALEREKSLRAEIEEASKDRQFNQSKICDLQLKVQECQNIVGTSAQLIRMIGDTNRTTAQNVR